MQLTKNEKNYIEVSPIGICKLSKKEELEYALIFLLREYITSSNNASAPHEALDAIATAKDIILDSNFLPYDISRLEEEFYATHL